MMCTFHTASGAFRIFNGDQAVYHCAGFSGRGEGRNNPLWVGLAGHGPIPFGVYDVESKKHPRFHAPAFVLHPHAQPMYGRSGFWIHGGTESHGCIVVGLPARKMLVLDKVHTLVVHQFEWPQAVDLNSDAQLTPSSVVS